VFVRANRRPASIVAFEETVVAFFLESASLLGVPKSLGVIYGICFATPEPLSFADVRDRLNLSAGSISQGLRVLREIGALKVVTNEGDHREFFAPDLELRRVITHYLEERVEKQLNAGRNRLREITLAIPRAGNGSANPLRDRFKSLQAWHHRSRMFLPAIKALLKLPV